MIVARWRRRNASFLRVLSLFASASIATCVRQAKVGQNKEQLCGSAVGHEHTNETNQDVFKVRDHGVALLCYEILDAVVGVAGVAYHYVYGSISAPCVPRANRAAMCACACDEIHYVSLTT